MDTKLQEIIQRLNHRLVEARRFQSTMTKRITQMDRELAKLKGQRSERTKKR